MIISRTPFRISFFGGGTDYPAWYRRHGGAVLAASIDKYCYLTCRYLPPFFEHRIRLVYRKIETCKTIDEIAHPVVKAVLERLGFERGLELHHDGDLPARSGMGSSSAFGVGLLNAIYTLLGQTRSKMELAQESIHVEQEIIRETVGSQDQVMAAFGGLRYVQFHKDDSITVDALPLAPTRLAELQDHLMLFYTGIARTASEVARTYVTNIESQRRQLDSMRCMVEESVDILIGGVNLRAFGHLLHEAWLTKRSLSPQVSTPQVDAWYKDAWRAGAVGGKLTGAGGGGFLLFFVPPEKRRAVRLALAPLLEVPFAFEAAGSQIIFNEPGVDYRAADLARQDSTRQLSKAI
jgi:D-glycero-alpha-D-manno-heptose-7-phosphate kinase